MWKSGNPADVLSKQAIIRLLQFELETSPVQIVEFLAKHIPSTTMKGKANAVRTPLQRGIGLVLTLFQQAESPLQTKRSLPTRLCTAEPRDIESTGTM